MESSLGFLRSWPSRTSEICDGRSSRGTSRPYAFVATARTDFVGALNACATPNATIKIILLIIVLLLRTATLAEVSWLAAVDGHTLLFSAPETYGAARMAATTSAAARAATTSAAARRRDARDAQRDGRRPHHRSPRRHESILSGLLRLCGGAELERQRDAAGLARPVAGGERRRLAKLCDMQRRVGGVERLDGEDVEVRVLPKVPEREVRERDGDLVARGLGVRLGVAGDVAATEALVRREADPVLALGAADLAGGRERGGAVERRRGDAVEMRGRRARIDLPSTSVILLHRAPGHNPSKVLVVAGRWGRPGSHRRAPRPPARRARS